MVQGDEIGDTDDAKGVLHKLLTNVAGATDRINHAFGADAEFAKDALAKICSSLARASGQDIGPITTGPRAAAGSTKGGVGVPGLGTSKEKAELDAMEEAEWDKYIAEAQRQCEPDEKYDEKQLAIAKKSWRAAKRQRH